MVCSPQNTSIFPSYFLLNWWGKWFLSCYCVVIPQNNILCPNSFVIIYASFLKFKFNPFHLSLHICYSFGFFYPNELLKVFNVLVPPLCNIWYVGKFTLCFIKYYVNLDKFTMVNVTNPLMNKRLVVMDK